MYSFHSCKNLLSWICSLFQSCGWLRFSPRFFFWSITDFCLTVLKLLPALSLVIDLTRVANESWVLLSSGSLPRLSFVNSLHMFASENKDKASLAHPLIGSNNVDGRNIERCRSLSLVRRGVAWCRVVTWGANKILDIVVVIYRNDHANNQVWAWPYFITLCVCHPAENPSLRGLNCSDFKCSLWCPEY